MFMFGIFIFFSIRRSDKHMPIKTSSKELEITETDSRRPVVSNNISELLLAKSNLTFLQPNNTAGMDMRLLKEPEVEVANILIHLAKKELLSFLENPDISETDKIERIQDPEIAELLSSSNNTTSSTSSTTTRSGFRMGAGGFWQDWQDSIFLFL